MALDAAMPHLDQSPDRLQFLDDVLAGLREHPKRLPCKYFYDEAGSALFDRICDLPEYYPTRTERSIMASHAREMATAIGPEALVVEFGSGSSSKTRLLLDVLERPAAYVPVDISREHLLRSAAALRDEYPALEILPVAADFTAPIALPPTRLAPARRVVYFPGSTIGNFTEAGATALLRGVASICGRGGALLIGADLKKDSATLERAYDDSAGVTAAFNRNLLARMNRELGADFDLDQFDHNAVWVEESGRIEMHLVSRTEQAVCLDGEAIRFAAGEAICTEHSHKYTLDGFAGLGSTAGFAVRRVWTDEDGLFSVQLLEQPR